MTRLYMKAKSDTHKSVKTMTGNTDMSIQVFYGSKNNSKEFLNINIVYDKDMNEPVVFINGVKQ